MICTSLNESEHKVSGTAYSWYSVIGTYKGLFRLRLCRFQRWMAVRGEKKTFYDFAALQEEVLAGYAFD